MTSCYCAVTQGVSFIGFCHGMCSLMQSFLAINVWF
jgi:hypothetical protein